MNKSIQHLLAFVAEDKAAINEEFRSVRFVISSDKIDRDSERIEVAAIAGAIKEFSKNPAALACHQHRLENGKSPVVGSWDTDSYKAAAHTSEMSLNFAKTELGEEYWQLYKDRHMRAVSIGFIPQEWHEEKTDKDGRIYVITKLELLEISCVAVGSNREALSKVKGLFDQPEEPTAGSDSTKAVIEAAVNTIKEDLTKMIDDYIIRVEDSLDDIKALLVPDPGGLADELLLGSKPDQSGSEGTTDKPEQLLEVLQRTIDKFKNERF